MHDVEDNLNKTLTSEESLKLRNCRIHEDRSVFLHFHMHFKCRKNNQKKVPFTIMLRDQVKGFPH